MARTFHRLLGLMFLFAWWSLGVQVQLLIGSRGLMPIAPFLEQARDQLSWWQFPTLFWLRASDGTLTIGVLLGVLLAICSLSNIRPRLMCALQVILYLSYATAARTFLSFQWDNLILECALFGTLLPTDRPAPLVHTLFRLILCKLYWESGIAKWQSPLHDWQNGSAMALYYETAPLPTWLGWYAHHLPLWWHQLESWGTLLFELGAPLGILGPRPARLVALGVLTSFQIINLATANYGFFCYLAIALHLYLLDDQDLERAAAWLRSRLKLPLHPAKQQDAPVPRRWTRVGVAAAFALFVGISLVDGLLSFVDSPRLAEALVGVQRFYGPWRVVNTYHLFAAVTTERIEPEVQTFDGMSWQPHDFRYKPGEVHRAPALVAPHQPRVDFRLWFYGLNFQREPEFVARLVKRLCRDPKDVQPLFAAALPPEPKAIRLVFWQYHFSSRSEHRRDGAWWTRRQIAESEPVWCNGDFADILPDDE